MSEELVWKVIDRYSSKQLRRRQPRGRFTIEKGSLQGKRRFYDSGYALRKTIDISANDDGIPVLSIKNDKAEDARKPDKMWKTHTLNGGVRKALARTEQIVMAYNPTLKEPAMRKVSAIYKALGRKNRGVGYLKLLVKN